MKNYFYSNGIDKEGPFTLEELKQKKISQETLIWHDGLEDWITAINLPELEFYFIPTIPVIENANKKNGNYTFFKSIKIQREGISINYPWRRFFARMIDLYVLGYSFFTIILFYIILELKIELTDDKLSPYKTSFFVNLLLIPIEAILISVFGTTLGKWMFGIYVLDGNKTKIGFYSSISRSIQLFVYGIGLSIPGIGIFTRITSYRKLISDGITKWDENIGSSIFYKEISKVRLVASIALFIILTLINIYITYYYDIV